jgi:serine/threonine protein kinase
MFLGEPIFTKCISLTKTNFLLFYFLNNSDAYQYILMHAYQYIDLFIIMEYCAGGDLSSYFRKPSFDTPEFLRCCEEILAGIEYLHKKGVAHRDLKPANVWL